MLDVFGSFQSLVLIVLIAASLGLKVWALVDVLRTRAEAFPAAGKRTRTLWLAIVGVALAVNVVILYPLNFINLIGAVAAIVYLVDVRPAVRAVGRGGTGGQHMGPYGPW
ncbi:MAG TPA: DUF2516 family protein [Jiangellales bacterium]|nr:DUF2516 family protein [Jiangellales bacterium]